MFWNNEIDIIFNNYSNSYLNLKFKFNFYNKILHFFITFITLFIIKQIYLHISIYII